MRKTLCLTLGCLLVISTIAAEKKPESLPTHKVKAAPFMVEVKLDGLFVAKTAHEIRLQPKSWSDFTVLKAIRHGTMVKKGDVLVQLDPEKLDQSIREKSLDLEVSRLDLELAKVDLEVSQETAPLDLASVEREYNKVKEDLDRFLEVTKPHDIKSAKFSAISSANYLAYAEEELKQLKKMYAADDVTEETEEIILKRTQDSVDRARHSLVGSKIRSETSLKFTIPRDEQSKKDAELRKRLTLAKAQAATRTDLKKKTIALEKQRTQHKLAQAALEKLKEDRSLMTIKAPADGFVYYGSFDRGVWSGLKAAEPKLRPQGKLLSHSVFMTIVDSDDPQIQASLDEKDLHKTKTGMRALVLPKSDPDRGLAAVIVSVSPVPIAPGKFEVVFKLTKPGGPNLLPGMNCSISVMVYRNEQALTVPTKSIHEEVDVKVVYVKTGKGHRKATVKTGQASGDKTEILKGIKAGDEVLLEKPSK